MVEIVQGNNLFFWGVWGKEKQKCTFLPEWTRTESGIYCSGSRLLEFLSLVLTVKTGDKYISLVLDVGDGEMRRF
jgi:hypothetical protein